MDVDVGHAVYKPRKYGRTNRADRRIVKQGLMSPAAQVRARPFASAPPALSPEQPLLLPLKGV